MPDQTQQANSRRSFIKGSLTGSAMAAALSSAPFVKALQSASTPGLSSRRTESPYGPLRPVKDEVTGLELLQLPAGFSYATLSWTGDLMSNGDAVPPGHDGMGVITVDGDNIVLVRNHELGAGRMLPASAVYDGVRLATGNQAAGGNTTLHFSRATRREVATIPSLGGTLANCAGGVTPWGTWLSCEETVNDMTADGGRRHGYVFEVRADAEQTTAVPIVGMGRYKHEAAAVDPVTSFVYLTEDNRNRSPLYRYLPDDTSQQAGSLEQGGRLQAARVKGVHAADLLTPALGEEYDLEWIDVADPDADPVGDSSGPCVQARAGGALTISRGEGIWYADGLVYIVDTSAGYDDEGRPGHGNGAVWMLDPQQNRLRCIFASSDEVMANNPDNVTISPRGGIVMCEDGGGVQDEFGFGERVMGLTPTGDSYIFAKNNIVLSDTDIAVSGKVAEPGDYRNREIAGACFDPSGEFLFINIQTPGITFAIWGPWDRGPI
ncbi:PhoX family protein [Pseudohongiella spirulinae]|uniref:Twin-arginine translocation pathway signal protein n=1 Tax=Pseudohongiella spirulinae TaxID=1249552 RepID=A0A0S2KA99_9GAMM|nr:alkaline phosphatase PhoX [Pseudohongiella spirulinae]ALO45271.1 Twin-arginine translocation pathway signal protein [Pseudohongiella spirulinae]